MAKITPFGANAAPKLDSGMSSMGTTPDVWNSDNWKGDAGKLIDEGRQFGGIGLGAALGTFRGQMGDLQQGADIQKQARDAANQLLTPQGRAAQVRSFGRDSQRQAYEMGKMIASRLAMQGIQGQEGAAQLGAMNRSAEATQDYAADLESPEGRAKLLQMIMQLNDPEAIVSILPLLMQLNNQDMPRVQLHETLAAQDAAGNGLGGILGNIVGMATGGGTGGFGGLLGGLFGGGGGKGIGNAVGGALSGLGGLGQQGGGWGTKIKVNY